MINVRLWIEYGVIAALIAVGGIAVTNYYKSRLQEARVEQVTQELDHVNDRLGTAETVNETQQKVILDLADQRNVDGQRIVELIDSYSTLSQNDKLLRNRLSTLEKNDAAKKYLDTPVPDAVGCLYDETCPTEGSSQAGGGQGTPAGSAAPTVRPDPKGQKAK